MICAKMMHCSDFIKIASISTAAVAVAFDCHRSLSEKQRKKLSQIHNVHGIGYSVESKTPYFSSSVVTQCNASSTTTTTAAASLDSSYKHPQKNAPSEISPPSISYKPLSNTKFMLYKLHLLSTKSLPVPRLLSQNDPVFIYHKLQKGLKQRQKDEIKLRKLQIEINALVEEDRRRQHEALQQKQQQEKVGGDIKGMSDARNNEQKMKIMKGIMERISEIAYGTGITPQMREDFLIVSWKEIN